MITKVREFCRQKALLCRGDRILVGLSGGADSVCLFLVLEELKNEWDLWLEAVHVNHRLRGEQAEADERFCRELCGRYGVPFHAVSAEVGRLAKENGWTVEEAGRNVRYEAFARLQEERQLNKLAVAHHKNDQAETVLFQLLRGSRLKGLAGMEAEREGIIRPLLGVTREEIEAFLAGCGQAYCTDLTNAETEYTRNRIRHRLLPEARQIQPQAVEHIAETAEYLGRVEAFLAEETERRYGDIAKRTGDGEVTLQTDGLLSMPPVLAERAVYRALCEAAGGKKDITAQAVRDCMTLCTGQSGKTRCLPMGITAAREFDTIRIYREKADCAPVEILVERFPFRQELPYENGMISLTLVNTLESTEKFIEKMGGFPKSNYTKWFDYDKIKNSVSLRTPRPEDKMAVYADGRSKMLTDVLAEAKIPSEKRKQKLVLACGNEVLFVPGVRGSEAYRVTEQTKRILIVQGGNTNGRED